MMNGKYAVIILLAAWFALSGAVSVAFADGGAVRFSERQGDRLITVFTAPTPARAGIVDVSVLVQDADSGTPLPDVPIVVYAYPIHDTLRKINAPATTEAATNKLMRAARLEFSEAGWWHVEVNLEGGSQEPPISFDIEVAEALPPWLTMSLWIGWPLAAIVVFTIHQLLVHRRRPITCQLAERVEGRGTL